MECYVAAQKAKDPQAKETFLELMRLADQIERFELGWLDRGYPDTD